MKQRLVEVNDKMQQGYAYLLTEPMGRNFHNDFQPALTPKDMLALGVFGGKYMTDCPEGDLTCRPKQRQALLHWAYDTRRV